jgi:hypothetical protein
MGASCTRFVEDFLDSQNEDHVLIDALQRNKKLRVQLLIPDDSHLDNDGNLLHFQERLVCGLEERLRSEKKS